MREDGLIDIEGVLVDTKPRPFEIATKTVEADNPIHLMRLCLTINTAREILGIRASSEQTPYNECREVELQYQRLIGLRIDSGFTRTVKQMFAGTQGCTHMTELLPTIATTAFQAIWSENGWQGVSPAGNPKRKSPINGCHALRADGHVVRTYFQHHLENREGEADAQAPPPHDPV